MKLLRGVRIGPGTVLGTAALAVALGGVALAAPGGQGKISACVSHRGGGLYRAGKCAKGDRRLSWNVTGPAGEPGPAGATGPQGAPGAQGPQGAPGSARAWAFVNADGTVETRGGSIAIGIERIKPGEYCVRFSPELESATFLPIVATIQGEDRTAALISVNTSFGGDCNGHGAVGVFTMDTAGAPKDHQFVVALL